MERRILFSCRNKFSDDTIVAHARRFRKKRKQNCDKFPHECRLQWQKRICFEALPDPVRSLSLQATQMTLPQGFQKVQVIFIGPKRV